MRLVLIAVLVATLGCASLIVNDYDSAAVKAGKITGRVLLGIATLSGSEFDIATIKRDRKRVRKAEIFRQDWISAVRSALTKTRLSMIFRGPPTSCSPTGSGREVCQWVSGQKQTIYLGTQTGGGTLGSSRIPLPTHQTVIPLQVGIVVTAVCEVPTDGSDRDSESCSVSFR